ncbi:YpmS family protein [Limosilactobacillus reuteri]|uniref:YpmS family protein n=1 Tax=Limosilactobacillus reuteri TaxID=1598 RepID=UPI001E2CE851|nr:YpmS family protein [Limosilactobacillus reuteri]MCC4501053.1 YpmS family protein [Limosilactobacillus reuteri]MCC4505274.1 YpmS family protein [Limosilactobacillus reuteri]MCC4506436.1 YpmS family protein [Limosilactobacillus reuteri]
MKNSEEKKTNWWKWAFFCLVALIVISCGVVLNKATAPTPATTTSKAVKPSDSSVTVELNKKQVNALAANYLNQFLKGQKIRYDFIVGDQYTTLTGNTKFLGAKVRFAINFIPERLSNGNVLLRAKGLSVGRLNIPIKFVMGYIAKNYNIPKWVTINPQKKTVLLDLNRYSKHRSLKYSAQEINMQEGRFKFLITVPTSNE